LRRNRRARILIDPTVLGQKVLHSEAFQNDFLFHGGIHVRVERIEQHGATVIAAGNVNRVAKPPAPEGGVVGPDRSELDRPRQPGAYRLSEIVPVRNGVLDLRQKRREEAIVVSASTSVNPAAMRRMRNDNRSSAIWSRPFRGSAAPLSPAR
jgi:hypothetical protein